MSKGDSMGRVFHCVWYAAKPREAEAIAEEWRHMCPKVGVTIEDIPDERRIDLRRRALHAFLSGAADHVRTPKLQVIASGNRAEMWPLAVPVGARVLYKDACWIVVERAIEKRTLKLMLETDPESVALGVPWLDTEGT